MRDRALATLLSRELEPIVDMVAWRAGPDAYEVASADGSVRFGRGAEGYEVTASTGRDPLAHQDASSFGSLDAERADPHPHRSRNSYPLAYEQFSQLFDHPSAPDLCVVHSAAHNWEEQGGHIGEHGSLGVVQARAPFIVSGRGVVPAGLVERSCRLVDVAPTVLALLGAPPPPGLDGEVVPDVCDGAHARHVIGVLWDGTNANVLYDLVGRGVAPSVARLVAGGTAFRHGALSSLPTVTLANHTSVLTGLHPGHHGILHNAWVDRVSGRQVVTNSPATWATAMEWLDGHAETLHAMVGRLVPGGRAAAINEPCDVGAHYSTFDFVRRGEARRPPPDDLPDATERFVRPSKDYRWSSRADHSAVDQFCDIWAGPEPPAFTWVNFTLTDAAFHEGGPYSEMAEAAVRDSDARLRRMFDAVERSGRWDDTAFVLVADHGMAQTDPAVRGDWDVALREQGVAVRDEGYGFLYLT